jgi:hypothetical protein
MQREVDLRIQYTMRFVIGLVLLLCCAGGCSRPPDEERLRSTIEAMRQGAEARKASDVLDGIAADFTGRNGEVDRDGLARILKLEFLRTEAVGVALGPIAVEIDGDRATARFDMTLTDRTRRWLPSAGGSATTRRGRPTAEGAPCPLSRLRERVRVRAALRKRFAYCCVEPACPHPSPLPQAGEGEMRQAAFAAVAGPGFEASCRST